MSVALSFFSAPRVTDIGFDNTDLWYFMQDGGRLVEVSGLNESYLSVEAIADRVRALWAHADQSAPLIATELFIVVLARSDHRSNDRWLYLWDSLNDTIGEDRHIYLESRIGTGETAAVSLWIAEGKQ